MHFIQQSHLLKFMLAVAMLTTLVTLTTHSSPLIAHATETTTPPILISELYPAPPTGESEWIELYNTTAEPIELVGWTLEDLLTTPSTIFIFTTQTIGSHEYLVVTLPVAKLNNSGDGIVLKNNQNATVHSISYEGSSPGSSWSVAAGGELYSSSPTPSSVNAPQPTPTPTPTPSPAPTPTPTPPPATPTLAPLPATPTPASSPTPVPVPTPVPLTKETEQELLKTISLTEVNACPASGQVEWIELYNASTTPVTISNWKVTDEAGNTRTISGTLPARSYQILSWSGSLLNNAGDSLTLTTPLGNTIATGEYQDCQVGTTLYMSGESWFSGPPTPGVAPLLTELTPQSISTTLSTALQTLVTDTQDDQLTTAPSAVISQNRQTKYTMLYNNQPLPSATILPGELYLEDQQDPHKKQSTGAETALSSLFASTSNANLASSARSKATEFQSGILGGLCFLLAGGYAWYVQSETSPLDLVKRVFATSLVGRPHFLSQLAKYSTGI